MSKKINLLGKSLALTNYWSYNFQLFGKNFFYFKKYFSLLFYLKKFIIKNKLSYLNFFFTLIINFHVFKEKVQFSISIFKLNNFLTRILCNIFPIWLFQNKYLLLFQGKIFIFPNFYFSQFFLKDLIFFLVIYKRFSPKKIFHYFSLLLKKSKNYLLVNSSKKGIYKKKLIGFKIQLKGKFEITKNAMSKKLSLNYGQPRSTILKNHITFCEHTFFSKLGSSNLKIWLFYDF